MTLPFISCLCPTYRRPRLLANAVACFFAQDYPKDRCELVILDDAQQLRMQCRLEAGGTSWRIVENARRIPSLPEKYNAMPRFCRADADIFCIWEDDDIYLPWHLSAHAAALEHAQWSKPSRILSTYPGDPVQEDATGRFFASIAVRRSLWEQVGGIVETPRADFDQQSLARFRDAGGMPGNPLNHSPSWIPGYCFRWGSTAAYHGQGQMRSPDDTEWYSRCADLGDPSPVTELVPQMDAETRAVYGQFTGTHHDDPDRPQRDYPQF